MTEKVPVTGKSKKTEGKKNLYDKTSTARSQRLAADIKAAGGKAFTVRFKTAAEVRQLEDLIEAGIGRNGNEVLQRLVSEKHAKLKK